MTMFKRKCFYLSGFDPRGAAYYHRLYSEQAQRHAAQTSESIAVSRRKVGDEALAGWQVANATRDVETDYQCLRWEDLVRAAWIRDPLKLLLRGLATYGRYLRLSDWPRVLALPHGPLTTLYYPLAAMLLVPLALALVAGLLLALLLPWWAAVPAGIAIGVAGAVPILVRMRALWLVRLYVFNKLKGLA